MSGASVYNALHPAVSVKLTMSHYIICGTLSVQCKSVLYVDHLSCLLVGHQQLLYKCLNSCCTKVSQVSTVQKALTDSFFTQDTRVCPKMGKVFL